MKNMPRNAFPKKFGAKIHPSHQVERRLFGHNPEWSPFVVSKVHRSSWFANNPREAFLSPEQDLFFTTYEEDDHLLGRKTTQVVDRIDAVQDFADGVFVGDRPTYPELSRRELAKEIEEGVQRQLAAYELLQDRNIDVPLYPTILGWKEWHLERCRPLVEKISRRVGFDATQYNSKYRLQEHVERVEEVLDVDIFVNGCVSVERLEMLPRSVVACSGNYNIIEEARDTNGTPRRENLPKVVKKRLDALNTYQSELEEFL